MLMNYVKHWMVVMTPYTIIYRKLLLFYILYYIVGKRLHKESTTRRAVSYPSAEIRLSNRLQKHCGTMIVLLTNADKMH